MSQPLAVRLARRELRGGVRGFRIFLACLTLGVAAIASVQSISSGIVEGLRRDGQSILGGDVAVRRIYRPADDDQRAHFEASAEVSNSTEMRAMAANAAHDSTLIELKAVDAAYPLFGAVELAGGMALDTALARIGGIWGAAIEDTLLTRLELAVGDRVTVGDAAFEIRAVIDREPDRAGGSGFSLGPRLMIAGAALAETGLVREGSQVYYHYRLRLPPGGATGDYVADLRERFPDAGWRIREFDDAAPRLERMIRRLTLFLTLVGLTALLVGGVGVGNAVKAYLDGKIATIATFKCLGAPGRLVFQTYLAQILLLAAAGIVAGLVVGAAAPLAVNRLLSQVLPIDARIGLYPSALLTAAAFGLLTALTFSLWPLARARDIAAASLFRDLVAPAKGWPRPAFVAATAAAAAALGGLAIATADQKWFALWFVLGSAATIVAFRGAAWLIIEGTRRLGRPRRPGLRLALANLYRPGAPTANVVPSLGLGLTVLVAIALVEGNMTRQVRESIPAEAPAYFFVDIQKDQMEPFANLITAIDGAGGLDRVPSLRGRIVAINGGPAEQAVVDHEHDWILHGDRGVTYAARPRPNHTIVEGEWWPPDYAGPPLVSIYKDVGSAFGIGIGDRITVNVLGRDLEAEVANIRDIDWGTFGINFVLVFSPQPLASVPHTYIATVNATDAAEPVVQRQVTRTFANITAVRLKDALETVNDILRKIGAAVRSTAGITLVAGTLVLAGAVAAGHRRRVYDSVVLKVLGATRGDVLRAFLIEYGLLGLITAAIAGVIGTVTAWVVLTEVMEVDWVFLPSAVVTTAALCTAITVAFGFVGTWRALGQKAAPLLRNE